MKAGSDPIMLHIIDSFNDIYPIVVCLLPMMVGGGGRGGSRVKNIAEHVPELSCLFSNKFLAPSLCQTLNFCAQKEINGTHPYGKPCQVFSPFGSMGVALSSSYKIHNRD